MDPLSVAASVVGLLSAAAKISSALVTFTKNAKAAPKQAQSVLIEVNDISGILHYVQSFLIGQVAASKSRASMLLVEQVLVTLTGCVITFSELEEILTDLKTDGSMYTLDRIKWARKESKIAGIISRLQNHKTSLNLMLSILESKSRAEAERSVDRLCDLVEEVLANNLDMSTRLRGIESRVANNSGVSAKSEKANASARSTIASETEQLPGPPENTVLPRTFRWAFEEDLDASKVYKRALYNNSQSSLISSAARSTASSVLSGLSLGDVSVIAVFALPLYPSDITNNQHYTFGDVPEQPLNLVAGEPEEISMKSTFKPWKQSSSLGLARFRRGSSAPSIEPEPEKRIFGIALGESVQYANVAISGLYDNGESFVWGHVPIVIAKCGVFLKKKAVDVKDIFKVSGSAKRMRELEAAFDRAPRYGIGLDWTGYTVHDAASLLLRYLIQLPESLIPTAFYSRALCVEVDSPVVEGGKGVNVDALFSIIRDIPPFDRSALLYILDLLSTFASHSENNGASSLSLASIFTSCILANHAIENTAPAAYATSRNIVKFMIEFPDDLVERFYILE